MWAKSGMENAQQSLESYHEKVRALLSQPLKGAKDNSVQLQSIQSGGLADGVHEAAYLVAWTVKFIGKQSG